MRAFTPEPDGEASGPSGAPETENQLFDQW